MTPEEAAKAAKELAEVERHVEQLKLLVEIRDRLKQVRSTLDVTCIIAAIGTLILGIGVIMFVIEGALQ